MKIDNKMFFPQMEKNKKDRIKEKIFEILFEADTFYGRLFHTVLFILILINVALVMLESVQSINTKHHLVLNIFEWIITILFSIEYALRIYSVKRPIRYIFSFYGIVDLLSILPTYLGIFYPSTKYLSSIRILRLLRVFRIFKLTKFLRGGTLILIALRRSSKEIVVFLSFITIMIVVIGALIYVIEGNDPNSPITSIPAAIYWAAVTVTTVGYGDITPVSSVGRFLATVLMLIGYGVILVPTVIATEIVRGTKTPHLEKNTQVCQHCYDDKHMDGANFCKTCGYPLHSDI
ncbi:MAG: ion transporter [Chitinophagales bacterium]|nr:ion transporter [Chitinophagales bacterium]